MTRINIVIAAGLALAVTLPAVSAQAHSPRTFVSAAGSDSNPCSFALPCRHFQAAVNATAVGGEVDALDPAGYGPITINHAITIEGQGWSYIAPPANGNGITINAESGNVVIHGVSLNGAGITGGTNGIVFNSGDGLTISDCVVHNFAYDGSNPMTGNGILIAPNSTTLIFAVTNTTASDNGNIGLYYLPQGGNTIAPTRAAISHIVATNNQFGIVFDTSKLGIANVEVAISSIIADNNRDTGIAIGSGSNASLRVSIDSIEASNNINYGITAGGTAKVFLGRSVITSSIYGIFNSTSPNTFYTYNDNRISSNGINISSALNIFNLQ
jgi:hypothetical protein